MERVIVNVTDKEVEALEFFSKMKGALGDHMKTLLEKIECCNPKEENLQDIDLPF